MNGSEKLRARPEGPEEGGRTERHPVLYGNALPVICVPGRWTVLQCRASHSLITAGHLLGDFDGQLYRQP